MTTANIGVTDDLVQLPSDQNASGRTLGDEEIQLVSEAIRSGTLTSTKGQFVKAAEETFASMIGVRQAHACSSGTAAIHTAIAAIDPEPGDEIITSPITDIGALTPILYQGAIPVFADVDPDTGNVTASTIESRLSDRTKAIVVTHLFGCPCEMNEIVELAAHRGVPVIEDCAQAFLARQGGRFVGTLGAIGCFSLQQGKHITTGEGGIVVTDDEALARRMFLYINKAWGYGDPKPDHYFLALNYRMSELQGAVTLAQLPKLEHSVASRISAAQRLTAQLRDLPGIQLPEVAEGTVHTFWKYCLMVDPEVIPDGAVGLGRALRDHDIVSAPRYIQKPAFMCEVFQKRRTFGSSGWPLTLARNEAVDYNTAAYPGTMRTLDQILVLPWNERYTEQHVTYLGNAIRDAVRTITKVS